MAVAAVLAGCSADATPEMRRGGATIPGGGGAAASAGAGGAAHAGSAGADFGNTDGPVEEFEPLPSDAPLLSDAGSTEACVQDSTEATLEKLPIDIIIPIDTSGSMDAEIAGIETNINDNFANLLADSGIDYRVITLANTDVCIGGTLNPTGCGLSTPPTYYGLYQEVGSNDAWCVLLDTYTTWRTYIRPEAFKVFVVVTDDSPDCGQLLGQAFGNDQASAAAFDAALLALDPVMFGTAQRRNYVFHSLVALADNTPATEAYEPTDAIVMAQCPTGAGDGVGYQHLSQLTSGLRFPVCEGNNFDAVFRRIAEGITTGAAVACEFPIPAQSADGKLVDRDTIEVAYVPGDMSATIKLDRADDVAACASEAFFVEGDTVKLCPTACDAVKADPAAQVQVLFGCAVCGGLDVECGTKPPPELPPIE